MEKEKGSEKPKKRGEAVKLQDGSPGLVNPKGQAYRASTGLLKFWGLCEGSKTERELAKAIIRPGVDKDVIVSPNLLNQ